MSKTETYKKHEREIKVKDFFWNMLYFVNKCLNGVIFYQVNLFNFYLVETFCEASWVTIVNLENRIYLIRVNLIIFFSRHWFTFFFINVSEVFLWAFTAIITQIIVFNIQSLKWLCKSFSTARQSHTFQQHYNSYICCIFANFYDLTDLSMYFRL